jgi:hypothetical protein
VFTGAMRPWTVIGSDAQANLFNAIVLADGWWPSATAAKSALTLNPYHGSCGIRGTSQVPRVGEPLPVRVRVATSLRDRSYGIDIQLYGGTIQT